MCFALVNILVYFEFSDGYCEEYLEVEQLGDIFSEHESDNAINECDEELDGEVNSNSEASDAAENVVDNNTQSGENDPAPNTNSATETSSFTPLDKEDNEDFNHVPISSQLCSTFVELLKLKSENSLSTKVMNQFIRAYKRINLEELPKKYESVEDELKVSDVRPVSKRISGKLISYFPIHRWLHIIVMLNLLVGLMVTCNPQSSNYTDISSGTWFSGFLARVPEGYTPLAIDIYYDHFGVSNSEKLGGLYFTIANLPPDILMKPDNKFVLSLLPTGVNLQDVLRLVLNDLIYYQGKFTITIAGEVYKLYCEIARLVGDNPGLAELCACLNHSALSPCRKCRIPKKLLQVYNRLFKKKLQARMKRIWRRNLPKLAHKGRRTGKGVARKELQKYGLKGIRCVWLQLPASHQFDYCLHSVECLMHNEELGLLLQEIDYFTDLFDAKEYAAICKNMKDLPMIPGLPKFKAGWFEHLSSLLAKEVLVICKKIVYASFEFCENDDHKMSCWDCLVVHIHYFNMLGQPELPKNLVPKMHDLILEHHNLYKQLYLVEDNGEEAETSIIKPHVGLHWQTDISKWGMPVYFSTMHWEPKHKKLKLIKQHQTNNKAHGIDILEKEWHKQMCRTIGWKQKSNSTFILPSVDMISKFVCKRAAIQAKFRLAISAQDLKCLKDFIMASVSVSQLSLVKWMDAYNCRVEEGSVVMVNGPDNSLWFGKVLKIFAYFVDTQLFSVYLKLQWYTTELPITADSVDQYTFHAAKLKSSADIVPLASMCCLVLALDNFAGYEHTKYPVLLDCCYYLRKWHKSMLDIEATGQPEEMEEDEEGEREGEEEEREGERELGGGSD